MKKNKQKKTSLKSAIVLLLLIALLLITSSYAWFTANQTVTVSTLQVNVKASNGLQISADAQNWKTVLEKADLTSAAGSYADLVNQLPETDLEPVSSIGNVTDGKMDMFYGVVEADADKAGEYYLSSTKQTDATGTKGKTTTTFMMREIFQKQGIKAGLIGTIAIYSGDKKLKDSDRTTPESIELQQLFAQMYEDGCKVVIMEVSSQSLKLNRVAGCDFDVAVFTNFSEDHISAKEHPNMEDYFNSKLKLFQMCKCGFVNIDDLHVCKVPKLFPDSDIKTYGIDNSCNLLAKDITITNSYVDFKVKLGDRNERVKVGIPGRFSVYNSLAAISVALKFGCDPETIKEALLEVRVPGRSELVNNSKDLTIMIDYAHSPESLSNILHAVKSYTRGRVISVFGCGGDRDSAKRPQMGEISGMVADFTIITSDNPRTEDPQKIVDQIEEGIKKTKGKYTVIVDRVEAIRYAINMASKKDIIVLAGKGHEPYQEINGVKHPFDERVIVNQIIKGEL